MSECGGNEFDGRLGLRISSIFVILVGSTVGAAFPIYAATHKGLGVPPWCFFVAKYFGSGVIVATAFVSIAMCNSGRLLPTNPSTDSCMYSFRFLPLPCRMHRERLFALDLNPMISANPWLPHISHEVNTSCMRELMLSANDLGKTCIDINVSDAWPGMPCLTKQYSKLSASNTSNS